MKKAYIGMLVFVIALSVMPIGSPQTVNVITWRNAVGMIGAASDGSFDFNGTTNPDFTFNVFVPHDFEVVNRTSFFEIGFVGTVKGERLSAGYILLELVVDGRSQSGQVGSCSWIMRSTGLEAGAEGASFHFTCRARDAIGPGNHTIEARVFAFNGEPGVFGSYGIVLVNQDRVTIGSQSASMNQAIGSGGIVASTIAMSILFLLILIASAWWFIVSGWQQYREMKIARQQPPTPSYLDNHS